MPLTKTEIRKPITEVKAIFWDNDGVLVDTESVYYEANRAILQKIGIDLTLEDYIDISLNQGQSVVSLAEKLGYNASEIANLRKLRDVRYTRLLHRGVTVIGGAEDVLKALHRKVKMAIVSSSPRLHFHTIHRTSALLPYFDFMLLREDYARSKPDPEPYLKALEISGCRPEDCLVIEDTQRGLEAARAAGIPCIVKPNAYTRNQSFEGAHCVIHTLPELITLIPIDSGHHLL